MTEALENRRKKLRMRSWRRGMKEMDLILGPFADQTIDMFSEAELDSFEAFLNENDQDLYLWVTGAQPCPEDLKDWLARISAAAGVGPKTA